MASTEGCSRQCAVTNSSAQVSNGISFTALAAKFNATIRAAIGRDAPRPERLAGLEALPQRVVTLPANVEQLKAFIAENGPR